MKKYYLASQINELILLLIIFITSCNVQDKTFRILSGQKESVSEPIPIIAGQPKIIIPKGTDPHAMFRCSMKDRAGNLWFGTTGAGIFCFNGTSFINFTEKDGLTNTIVYCILEDNKGFIWVGTANGVFKSDLSATQQEGGITFSPFVIPVIVDEKTFLFSENGDGNVSSNHSHYSKMVLSIIQDKVGNIWFGTENSGLLRYDPVTGGIANFLYTDGNWRIIPNDSINYYKDSFKSFIQNILEDKDGNIWFSVVGQDCGGVFRYDPSASHSIGGFTKFEFEKKLSSHIFYMIQDKTGTIWFATRDDGVCRYNPKAGGKIIECFTQMDGYCDRGANALLEDKNGNIWFSSIGNSSTNGGCVTIYNGKLKADGKPDFNHFSTEALSNNRIWTMIEDNSGNILFGTKDLGLYCYSGKTPSEDGAGLINFSENKSNN